MKLLLDENLSPTLAETLAQTYPATAHVREFGLQSAPDPKVWADAANHGCAIVTKDADFHHRSLLHGHPPTIIWIRLGNCSTRDVAEILIARSEQVQRFFYQPSTRFWFSPESGDLSKPHGDFTGVISSKAVYGQVEATSRPGGLLPRRPALS